MGAIPWHDATLRMILNMSMGYCSNTEGLIRMLSTRAQCPVHTDASYGCNAITYHYKQEKLGDDMGSYNNDQTNIDMVVHSLIK